MSTGFEWLTDEDDYWDKPSAERPSPKSWPRHWRVWSMSVFILGVLGSFLFYHRSQQQIEVTTKLITKDILSSYELLRLAIMEKDEELLEAILSGREWQWTEAQQLLLTEDIFLERQPWSIKPQLSYSTTPTVTLSPDLRAAELEVKQRYEVIASEPITLQHTYIFRRGQQRWLLSPPLPDYWGTWQVETGHFVTLTYPERDKTIAQRLLTDLDTTLADMCQRLPGIECPSTLQVHIRLEIDPLALAKVTDNALLWRTHSLLQLPTPTLVGLPVDEAAYEVLRQGYAAQVVAAALIQVVDWPCCEQGVFHQALIDKQLAWLGLRPWPLTPQAYERMFAGGTVQLNSIHRFWTFPPQQPLTSEAWYQVYGVIDYITHLHPDIPPITMQRRLAHAVNERHWLGQYVDLSFRNYAQERDWLRFASKRMDTGHLPDSGSPQQDIQLLCSSGLWQPRMLQRYNPVTTTWTEVLRRPRVWFMNPLPDDSGVLLQQQSLEASHSPIYLWQDGTDTRVLDYNWGQTVFRTDVVGDNLLLYIFDRSDGEISTDLIDLSDCNSSTCPVKHVDGKPIWSIEGEWALLPHEEKGFWLTNAAGLTTTIEAGMAPFWLDSTQYGYALAEVGIVSQRIGQDKREVLLPWQQLITAVDENPNTLTVYTIIVSPNNPSLLFIAVKTEAGPLILTYDRQQDIITRQLALRYEFPTYNPFIFSPDGRWLTIQSFDPRSTEWELYLHDVNTGETHTFTSDYLFTFPGYDWSADGQWLVRADDGYLHLIAPDSGYHAIIVHDFYSCKFAGWINR